LQFHLNNNQVENQVKMQSWKPLRQGVSPDGLHFSSDSEENCASVPDTCAL